MENLSSKVIEVTVISAEGLIVNKKRPAKRTVSVTVKIDPINARSTGVDAEGGSSPTWNEKLVMELPGNARCITVEALSGGRVIGSAYITVSEFCGGHLPENYLSFLSYRLRGRNGEKNGIINLSVKVKSAGSGSGSGNGGCASSCSRPWIGVPAVDSKAAGGIALGIPVSYRF